MVLDCLSNGKNFAEINQMYIVLIPKVKKAQTVKDYPPINLCNVIYKLIAKILANRIKLVLSDIVDKAQCALWEIGSSLIM